MRARHAEHAVALPATGDDCTSRRHAYRDPRHNLVELHGGRARGRKRPVRRFRELLSVGVMNEYSQRWFPYALIPTSQSTLVPLTARAVLFYSQFWLGERGGGGRRWRRITSSNCARRDDKWPVSAVRRGIPSSRAQLL